MSEFCNAVLGGVGARRGTRPDYPVDTTSAGLLAGVDEQLDCALRLAEGGTAPK